MGDRWKTEARGPRVLPSLLRLLVRLVVLVVGTALIVTSIAFGWLPGPGGIPLFLAGIALLATQFEWAKRVRSWVFARLRDAAHRARDRSAGGRERDDDASEDEEQVPTA